jgi:hypothetical protein
VKQNLNKIRRRIMREKVKENCNNTTIILVVALISGVLGSLLGVFAYYKQWLG